MISQTLPARPLTTHAPLRPSVSPTVWFRRVFRLTRLVFLLLFAALEIACRLLVAPVTKRTTIRAQWLQRTCRRLLRSLHIHADFIGEAPPDGLLVCNHLSYLDILVLGARQPMTFVSKKEVRHWPGIGWLTQLAGTVFIDREQRSDVARASAILTGKIARGTLVCFFPEGTSSGGSDVLPFRSSLLQPAVDRQWTITPAYLAYKLNGGIVEDEVCYWGDMTFGPHLLNLLGKKEIQARVRYGTPQKPSCDRKQLAAHLREQVRALAADTSIASMFSDV